MIGPARWTRTLCGLSILSLLTATLPGAERAEPKSLAESMPPGEIRGLETVIERFRQSEFRYLVARQQHRLRRGRLIVNSTY